jgi:hypothetical protein
MDMNGYAARQTFPVRIDVREDGIWYLYYERFPSVAYALAFIGDRDRYRLHQEDAFVEE